MKTDILKETMYFSYDPNSFSNLYALPASDVKEIIAMNRNGVKPESLKTEPDVTAPEFVSAVGDDSITRFDETRKKKKRQRQGKPARSGQQKEGGERREPRDRKKDGRGPKPQKQAQPKQE